MKKLTTTYKLKRGGAVSSEEITLPITCKRYQELERMDNHSDTFAEIKNALEALCSLQQGELGSWGYTLEVETDEK